MSEKNGFKEKIVLFLIFFVFAILVVAFAYCWDDITAGNLSTENDVSFQYTTVSKTEFVSSDDNKSNGLININTADIAELDTLPGIGEAKAQAIIDYRTENGNFNSISDIKKVSGIGDSIFEKIKPYITV